MKKGGGSLGSEQRGNGWGRHDAVPLARREHASPSEVRVYVDLLGFRHWWSCALIVTLIGLGLTWKVLIHILIGWWS